MQIGIITLLGFLIYWGSTSDQSGIPYPTTVEEMREEIKKLEVFLTETEKEYREMQAYANTVYWSNPLSQVGIEAMNRFGHYRKVRTSAQCRIKNLTKMIGKYEEINNDINSRNIIDSGLGRQ